MGTGYSVPAPQKGPAAADRHDPHQARRVLTPTLGLGGAQRLRRTSDIHRVLRIGKRRRTTHLELIWADSTAGLARMGLIVPKFRHSAVARNRVRRRLKEIWRTELQHHQGPYDLLIRARPDAYQAPFGTLKQEMIHWRDAVRTAQ